MKKENPFYTNRWEIIYTIINSLLAAALIFLGAFSDGQITKEGILLAAVAALVTFLVQFKQYWDGEKGEFKTPKRKILLGRLI